MPSICGENPINCLDFQKEEILLESMTTVFQLFVNI